MVTLFINTVTKPEVMKVLTLPISSKTLKCSGLKRKLVLIENGIITRKTKPRYFSMMN